MQPDYKKQFAIAHSTPSGATDFNFGTTPTVPNANGATSPAKSTYVSNLANTMTKPTITPAGSPGSYQGTVINAGTDAQVSAQMAAIDAARGSTTGGGSSTTTPPPAPVKSAADTSFETYLQSLQQPEEVTAQTEYLNKLNLQSKLDQEKALASGETLGFATGEAQRVARNNALYLEAAGNTLDALVAKNASKSTIAKARFDYEQAKITAEKDNQKPFELSPGQERYTYNKTTGKYEKTASVAPTPKAADKQTEAEKKAPMVSDVNNAVTQLRTIVKTKGFKGVSPDDYISFKDYFLQTYGYEGVAELDKAMAALGLVVDNTVYKK